MGHYRESIALLDTIAGLGLGSTPERAAANRALWLVRVATVAAAMNDTLRLAVLNDTIRILGSGSPFARDLRSHHYVRGLLFAQQGRDERAVAEFRQSIVSPLTDVAPQLQIARSLLRLGRAREAATMLSRLIRARFMSITSVSTHTELHELSAQAWDAAGEPDSALVHYRAVAQSWRRADPFLRDRFETARARLAALQGSRNAP